MMMIMNASDCRRLRSGSAGVYLPSPRAPLYCLLACGCLLSTCGFLSQRLSVLLSLSLSTSALHRRPACLSTVLLSIAHADVFRIRMRSSRMRVRPPEYAFCRVSPSPNCYILCWVPDLQLWFTTNAGAGARRSATPVSARAGAGAAPVPLYFPPRMSSALCACSVSRALSVG
jgi:hypothetical protein